MSDFEIASGFEDLWRPKLPPRGPMPQSMLRLTGVKSASDIRAHLTRMVNRTPEVVVIGTGRPRDLAALRAHFDYISRKGRLELEDRDGAVLRDRHELNELSEDWSDIARSDRRWRPNSAIAMSLVLSVPANTDAGKVWSASRAFATYLFADEYDYVFAKHTDRPNPHAHLTICARSLSGRRLSPNWADFLLWRELFAQTLRDLGVEVQATPRWARGVTRKSEHSKLRRIRERFEAGRSGPANVLKAAYRDAVRGELAHTIWEDRILASQTKIRTLYLTQADLLKKSNDPMNQRLGVEVEAFVRSMPAPDSRRLAIAREIRAVRQVEEMHLSRNDPERAR